MSFAPTDTVMTSGCSDSKLRHLLRQCLPQPRPGLAEIDDAHALTGAGAQLLGDQSDVAPARTAGADALGGGVAHRHVEQSAAAASLVSPPFRGGLVRAEEVSFAAMAAALDQPHDDGAAHHNEGDDGDHPK